MKLPRRIFDLFYGQPASGKSEAIRELIEYVLKQHPGKKARVIVGDGSLATYDHLIEQGKVEAVEFSNRKYPIDVVQRLTEGWFPLDGDPQGKLVEPNKQPTFNDCAFWAIEGASVMAQYVMSNIEGGLADLAGKGHKLGQDSPFQIPQGEVDAKGNFTDKEQGRNFGGNPPSHYGIGQRHITDAVQRSKGLGPYVVWTAHEATNDPEKSQLIKEILVGPEVCGKALTANFQRIFGNTLHFQTVAKRGPKIKDEFTGRDLQELLLDYRIWTQDHFSPDQNTMIRYKAVSRGVRGMETSYDNILSYYTALAEKKQEVDTDQQQ